MMSGAVSVAALGVWPAELLSRPKEGGGGGFNHLHPIQGLPRSLSHPQPGWGRAGRRRGSNGQV